MHGPLRVNNHRSPSKGETRRSKPEERKIKDWKKVIPLFHGTMAAEVGVLSLEDRERGHEPRNVASPGRWRRQMKPVLWSLQKECSQMTA